MTKVIHYVLRPDSKKKIGKILLSCIHQLRDEKLPTQDASLRKDIFRIDKQPCFACFAERPGITADLRNTFQIVTLR